MKCYTDYPLYLSEVGKEAPIRVVEFISYDGDKYCDVRFNGEIHSVKKGYLYSEPKRLTSDYRPKKYQI